MGDQVRAPDENGGENGIMAEAIRIVTKTESSPSKAPKSLSIARNGSKFTLSWKQADKDYRNGQTLAYRTLSATSWTYIGLTVGATSWGQTIAPSQFYPYTNKKITAISMSVKGRRAYYETTSTKKAGGQKIEITTEHRPQWSSYTNKQFAIYAPKAPTLSASFDPEYSNRTTFAVTMVSDSEDHYWTTDIVWESVLEKDCNFTSGKDAKWGAGAFRKQSGTRTSSGSIPIDESAFPDPNASYTRWFRAKQRGPGGDSAWVYDKHVYARPNQARVNYATAEQNSGQGYDVLVNWTAPADNSRPIDKTSVEYFITPPTSDMGLAPGATPSAGPTQADTGGTNAAPFTINDILDDNECLFVRVNTFHDTDTNLNYGVPYLVKAGQLAKPTNLTVDIADDPPPFTARVSATNEAVSAIADAFLVVTYKTGSNPENERKIGIIGPEDEYVVVTCPDWTGETNVTFGVYACIGTYTYTTGPDGVKEYAVVERMVSPTAYNNGSLPVAPATINVLPTDITGTVQVTWAWSWEEADSAELSWADHADAWYSTDEPSTYTINKMHASTWNISGLETGVTWYIRVRLINETADGATYGPYSMIASIDLASAPSIPTLTVMPAVITQDGSATASWGYVTTDGTMQGFADIAVLTFVNDAPVYTLLLRTATAQHLVLYPEELGWQAGDSFQLVVSVTSASGKASEWSNPVTLSIAEALEPEIEETSLENVTIDERTVLSLTEMPLTLTVTGAGDGGTTIIAIERAEDFQTDRPDETRQDGFEGETVCLYTQMGEAEITIDNNMLTGFLDDGAQYRIVATVMDGLQSASVDLPFEVHWEHQAVEPTATVEMDGNVAILTPIAPSGVATGDTCDIYRLSVDRPELIVKGATWGTEYVDPYPTIGPFGGHLFVTVTKNGDYTTETGFARYDTLDDAEDFLDIESTIIDFGSDQVVLDYDIDVSGSWSKDFTETEYLGGSIQGDWNPGVKRSGSVTARAVPLDTPETIEAMRRLAVYPGICHVRTPDGSSFAADVQVSESRSYQVAGKIATFDIKITRVDPEGFDGIRRDLYELE
jgi:hypothetical protein